MVVIFINMYTSLELSKKLKENGCDLESKMSHTKSKNSKVSLVGDLEYILKKRIPQMEHSHFFIPIPETTILPVDINHCMRITPEVQMWLWV